MDTAATEKLFTASCSPITGGVPPTGAALVATFRCGDNDNDANGEPELTIGSHSGQLSWGWDFTVDPPVLKTPPAVSLSLSIQTTGGVTTVVWILGGATGRTITLTDVPLQCIDRIAIQGYLANVLAYGLSIKDVVLDTGSLGCTVRLGTAKVVVAAATGDPRPLSSARQGFLITLSPPQTALSLTANVFMEGPVMPDAAEEDPAAIAAEIIGRIYIYSQPCAV